jgi:hypothetical protein
MAVVTEDELLIQRMSAPPPLEDARSSLAYWTRRRAGLPIYRRAARREADEMILRCRTRVAEAERRLYGTGVAGFVRRLLAGEGPSWPGIRMGLVMLVWSLVPRRFVMVALAVLVVWLLAGLLVVAGLIQLLS